MKIALITIGSIIGLFALAAVGTALNLITIPWLTFNSKIQMNRDIVTKTYNADNALYNYHWFQEKAGEIKAASQNIDVTQKAVTDFELAAGARSTWTFEDKTEDARLRAVAEGNKTYYNTLVQDYNAHANEVDRSIFQDGLPLFFSLK